MNFVFYIKIKAKSKYRILNFVFQFIKKTKCALGTRIFKPEQDSLKIVFQHYHSLMNSLIYQTFTFDLELITYLVYIIVVETDFKAGTKYSIKIFYIKKAIDQKRFSVKKTLVWNISEVFFTTTFWKFYCE